MNYKGKVLKGRMVRIISLILTAVLVMSVLTSCKNKDKETATDGASKSSEAGSDAALEGAEDATSAESTSDGESESTSAKSPTGTSGTTKTVTTTAAPVQSTPKTPEKSGLNNRPSSVENADNTKDLAQVNPEQAADYSYDTEVSISQTDSNTININDFPYVPYSDFKSHILSKWNSFTTQDRVKIDAQYMNEYLNYIVLPVRDSFFEINCNGYEVRYAYDSQYVYMDITWSYYINAQQYNACRTKVAEICSGLTGSTADKIKAVHDRLARENEYVINVDGAYNCLVNHRSDCDGYTAAFQLCMDYLGIPCKAYATSDHIFNCVQVDGKWYVVDVTFDDQTPSGFIYTRYFLTGYEMYVNYPILKSMLSASDYPYSKKLIVTDDAKFRAFLQIGSNVNYTLDDNGRVILDNGSYYTIK